MKRYLFEIIFNGRNYHGWQIQENAITVQDLIQQSMLALNSSLPIVNVTGCGRTDKGVHAEQFYFHVDLPEILNYDHYVFKLNQILPHDIAVQNCIIVNDDFHARFSATSRTYQYRMTQQKNPFSEGLNTYISYDLDIEIMNQCAEKLLNYKDFTSFSKVHTDVNNFNCIISSAKWTTINHQLIFSIKANRFLRNMVRAIVGTLILAGRHKIDVDGFCEIIAAKNRSCAGASVLAKGLFLTNVEYPNL